MVSTLVSTTVDFSQGFPSPDRHRIVFLLVATWGTKRKDEAKL